MMTPLVSVMMLVYNHEQYLAQALDSILTQKVDFTFEIVIGDDCSTDSSPAILSSYQSEYPEIIKVISHRKNVGAMNNHKSLTAACSGKYVALCEGDDYWTDENKLQLQLNLLELNTSLSFCCHRVDYLFEDEKRKESWGEEYFTDGKHTRLITIDSLFEPYLVRTVSVMYRSSMLDGKAAADQPYFKDLFLFALLLSAGDAVFLKDVMAVYRIHGKGVWSGQGTIKNLESNVRTAIAMAAFFKGRFKVIDDYAFVQTRNLYKQLLSGATTNRKLAAEFAGALAFKLKGKSAFAHRLKYIYHWATGKMYK